MKDGQNRTFEAYRTNRLRGCDGMRWDATGCNGMQWDADDEARRGGRRRRRIIIITTTSTSTTTRNKRQEQDEEYAHNASQNSRTAHASSCSACLVVLVWRAACRLRDDTDGQAGSRMEMGS